MEENKFDSQVEEPTQPVTEAPQDTTPQQVAETTQDVAPQQVTETTQDAAPQPTAQDFFNTAPCANAQLGYNNPYDRVASMDPVTRSNSIIDIIGNSLKSAPFIIFLIAISSSALVNVIGIFAPLPSNLFTTIQQLYGGMFSNNEILEVLRYTNIAKIIVGTIEILPIVLLIIGLFMIFSSRYDRPISTPGFGFVKAYAIIDLVFIGLSVLAAIAGIVLSIVAISQISLTEFGDALNQATAGITIDGADNNIAELFVSELLIPILVIGGVFILGALVLNVLYYSKMISTVSVIKKAGAEGYIGKKLPSSFLAIYSIIIAGLAFLAIASTLGSPLASISAVCGITAKICLGIYLLSLRKKLMPYKLQ